MKITKAHVLKAARDRWGANVEAFGHLNTIGRASNPYARDGQKEYHAMVRRTKLPSTAFHPKIRDAILSHHVLMAVFSMRGAEPIPVDDVRELRILIEERLAHHHNLKVTP